MNAPIPIKGQRIAAPNFERNIMIALFAFLFLGIGYGIYRIAKFEQNRAETQHQQEQRALQEHHAIETHP